MKKNILWGLLLLSFFGNAQELFTMTDPASNVAARSISVRVDQLIMNETNTSKTNYHLIPEVSIGINKRWMFRSSIFFSNRTDQVKYEGGSFYSKYRFFSKDGLQNHFRVAAFALVSYNNSDIHQEEISLSGHNTGFEMGIIATKLIRKVAVSSSASFTKAYDNGNNNKFIYGLNNARAVNYSISVGKLVLPREYASYRQTNLNLMVEALSQFNIHTGKYFVDIAPTIQFIFLSQSRIDISYRKQISSSLQRTAPNGFFVRLEHNFFNAF